jgi:hypothetical protein
MGETKNLFILLIFVCTFPAVQYNVVGHPIIAGCYHGLTSVINKSAPGPAPGHWQTNINAGWKLVIALCSVKSTETCRSVEH